jgi:hypothetical protein
VDPRPFFRDFSSPRGSIHKRNISKRNVVKKKKISKQIMALKILTRIILARAILAGKGKLAREYYQMLGKTKELAKELLVKGYT